MIGTGGQGAIFTRSLFFTAAVNMPQRVNIGATRRSGGIMQILHSASVDRLAAVLEMGLVSAASNKEPRRIRLGSLPTGNPQSSTQRLSGLAVRGAAPMSRR